MKQNNRIELAVDTYSSFDDDDDDCCDGEYVKRKLSNHKQSSIRWMEMEEMFVNWADIHKSIHKSIVNWADNRYYRLDQRIWRYAEHVS